MNKELLLYFNRLPEKQIRKIIKREYKLSTGQFSFMNLFTISRDKFFKVRRKKSLSEKAKDITSKYVGDIHLLNYLQKEYDLIKLPRGCEIEESLIYFNKVLNLFKGKSDIKEYKTAIKILDKLINKYSKIEQSKDYVNKITDLKKPLEVCMNYKLLSQNTKKSTITKITKRKINKI